MRLFLLLLSLLSASFVPAQVPKEVKRETLVRDLLRRDKPYKAINQCNAMMGTPAQPRFQALRADALNRIGEHGKALSDAQAATRALPGDKEALLQLGIAEQGVGALDSAIVRFEQLYRTDTAAEVRFHLAGAYRLAGRCAEVIEVLGPLSASADPVRAARALRLRGECAAVQGDSAAARKALDEAVALTPRDPVAYNSRGYYAYAHFDKHREAVEDYDRAIKLNPNYSYAFNNRGWSRYRMGDREQALKDINKAARRKVFNPFVYRNLGIITLEQGDTLKACGHFRKAISYGFTALYGPEVEDLVKANCGSTEPSAPVQAPNAPLPPRTGKPPVRSNAP